MYAVASMARLSGVFTLGGGMRFRWRWVFALLGAAGAGCGGGAVSAVSAPRAQSLSHWTAFTHALSPIDVALGRSDGVPVVAAAGRLYLLNGRRLRLFAPAYHSNPGLEAYIALPAVTHRGCAFGRDTVYAVRLQAGRGISRVTPSGRVSRFAAISAPGLINGITFDEVGRFGYRLLVTINHAATTTVDAVSCHGAVTTLTSSAPRVEGGIAVAPRSFGRFAGDLIAPDELSGRIFAVGPRGASTLVANSGLPHGQDFGVESEAFVPSARGARALVADRLTRRNRHPGDNVLLSLAPGALRAAGVMPGDLLVAGKGGALTDAVRCGASGCRVRYVANGPSEAHVEGHIAFVAG
jgi:hypothetical protein